MVGWCEKSRLLATGSDDGLRPQRTGQRTALEESGTNERCTSRIRRGKCCHDGFKQWFPVQAWWHTHTHKHTNTTVHRKNMSASSFCQPAAWPDMARHGQTWPDMTRVMCWGLFWSMTPKHGSCFTELIARLGADGRYPHPTMFKGVICSRNLQQ